MKNHINKITFFSFSKYLLFYFGVFFSLILLFYYVFKKQVIEQYNDNLRETTHLQLVAAATDLNNDILYLQQIDAQFIKVIREAHYDYHENSTYTSHVYQRIIDYNVSSSLINSIVYYSASRPEPYALITDATVRYEDGKFLLLN